MKLYVYGRFFIDNDLVLLTADYQYSSRSLINRLGTSTHRASTPDTESVLLCGRICWYPVLELCDERATRTYCFSHTLEIEAKNYLQLFIMSASKYVLHRLEDKHCQCNNRKNNYKVLDSCSLTIETLQSPGYFQLVTIMDEYKHSFLPIVKK